MALSPEEQDPKENISAAEELSSEALSDASTSENAAAQEAKLEQQVANAVASLEELKQIVVNRLFGLDGQPASSHEDIARQLTERASDELKASLAEAQGQQVEGFSFSVDYVKTLEATALRDLRG